MSDHSSEFASRYELTLKVDDGGVRTFTASGSSEFQKEFSEDLARDIVRMLGIVNDPPSDALLVEAMPNDIGNSPLTFLAWLHNNHWSGENRFRDCVRIVVDVGALCDGDDKAKINMVRELVAIHGYEHESSDTAAKEKS